MTEIFFKNLLGFNPNLKIIVWTKMEVIKRTISDLLLHKSTTTIKILNKKIESPGRDWTVIEAIFKAVCNQWEHLQIHLNVED